MSPVDRIRSSAIDHWGFDARKHAPGVVAPGTSIWLGSAQRASVAEESHRALPPSAPSTWTRVDAAYSAADANSGNTERKSSKPLAGHRWRNPSPT